MAEERLQKLLARAGIASRRTAEQMIAAGRVHVNGKPVRELGTRADPERDRIEVDGRAIARERHVYYLLHKPRAIVTTLNDPEGRPSLGELLQDVEERVYPVGRLDFHTSGALLLTNDGDLAQALLHPSHAVPKTYVAKIGREVDERTMRALESGVTLDDGYKTRGARVMHMRDEEGKSWIEITITEGKNRQIHRMFEALGARVMRLSRISFAGLSTEAMRPGELRPLSREEVDSLRRQYLPRDLLERSAERGHARGEGHDQEVAPEQERRRARADQAPRGGRGEQPREGSRNGRSEGSREGVRGARAERAREAPRETRGGQRGARGEGIREAPRVARGAARDVPHAARDDRGGRVERGRDAPRGARGEGARETHRAARDDKRSARGEGGRETARGARPEGARDGQRGARAEGAQRGARAKGAQRGARPEGAREGQRGARAEGAREAPPGARDGQRGSRSKGARDAQRGARAEGARETPRGARQSARDGRTATTTQDRPSREARAASAEPAQRSTRRQTEKSPAKVDTPRRAGHKNRPT
jgi:23S rRNA pseudouridine2605 synthase